MTKNIERAGIRIATAIGEVNFQRVHAKATEIHQKWPSKASKNVLALGHVQSGKTTAMSALIALAADSGTNLVVSILGVTNLLTDQNSARISSLLGFQESNYEWAEFSKLSKTFERDLRDELGRGRKIHIAVIKNASVLRKLAAALSSVQNLLSRPLLIDDEADQASLNTRIGEGNKSSVHDAIVNVKDALPNHLYVQFTATPYAPILLPPEDPLAPSDVVILEPGTGYTGGRSFFIENRDKVVRLIPPADEQSFNNSLGSLPFSLVQAVACFVAGAANLLSAGGNNAPVSMLIHASGQQGVQERVDFLARRLVAAIRQEHETGSGELLAIVQAERKRLSQIGCATISDEDFHIALGDVLAELRFWLLNSNSAISDVKWNTSPVHVLIGGNKLDRGFTVEGLTVTYLSRKASEQIDTIEQRARAFGYRGDLLGYCQFFASQRTLTLLEEIVHTEEDLRFCLGEFIERGGTVEEWARSAGLLIPTGSRPSRKAVLPLLSTFNSNGDWYSLRDISFAEDAKIHNRMLLDALAIFDFPLKRFQRMAFRHSTIPIETAINLISSWEYGRDYSSWPKVQILDFLSRQRDRTKDAHVFLLEAADQLGKPRVRAWDPEFGFQNLFQGRDLDQSTPNAYVGDRDFAAGEFGERSVFIQIHRLTRRGFNDEDLFTLAINLGTQQKVVGT